MAVAAAFGFDVAPDLLQPEPGPPVVATLAKDDVAPDAATAPILMADKALGVAAPATSSRGAAKPAPVPSAALAVRVESEARAMPAAVAESPESTPTPTIATPTIASLTDVAAPEAEDAVIVLSPELAADVPSVPDSEDDAVDAVADAPADVASPALEADAGLDEPSLGDQRPEPDAIAERLEAALLGQLRVLEETLQVPPSILPRTAPLRAAAPPERPLVQRAEPAGAPGRSPFAPDPVRQRTYIDLREPAPAPPPSDDAPWRKYLEEPRAATARPRPVRRPPASRPTAARPASVPVPAPEEVRLVAAERGKSIRAMSAAAVLGLGVGLGLLVLARPFAETTPAPVAALEPEAPAALAAADAAPPTAPVPEVDQALATLLSDQPQVQHTGPAVIAEAGTPAEALVADAAPIPPPVAEPPLIRPPPGQPIQVARAAPVYGPDAPSAPLAYGPSTPTYDPVRQSLLNDDAQEAAAEEADVAPAADRAATPRGDRATVRSFVNMRAKPDNGAAVVAVLAQGLSVRVLGCDYWCQIEAGGKRGYVYKSFVGR